MSMLHCGESGEKDTERQESEMESQCVRKSQRKCCLCVSERKREKVRKTTTERERERQAACVFVLYRD